MLLDPPAAKLKPRLAMAPAPTAVFRLPKESVTLPRAEKPRAVLTQVKCDKREEGLDWCFFWSGFQKFCSRPESLRMTKYVRAIWTAVASAARREWHLHKA